MVNKYPKELMKAFGIKNVLELKFVNPKKVLVRFDDDRDEIRERVSSITVVEGPGFPSIEVNYDTDEGTGSIGSAVGNFKEIVILD